jgi:putative glutamine amidotransferase
MQRLCFGVAKFFEKRNLKHLESLLRLGTLGSPPLLRVIIYPMKPRIAIPVPNSDPEYSTRALPDYVNSILGAGGEPVVLPLTLSNIEAAQLAKSCDGILLPGSPADVDPQKYGQTPHPLTAAPDAARDNLDELLLQDAHNMRKPILTICYGTQFLNVWRNGTLVQNIESPVQHARTPGAPRTQVVEHVAQVEPGSGLAALAGSGPITVNSSHHQAVDTPGDALRVVARSPQDAVIEAVEGISGEHWVLGVQWHPERTFEQNDVSRRIFGKLVTEARAFHQRLARSSPDFENVRID